MDNGPKIDIHQHARKMMYESDGTPLINFITGKPSTAYSDETVITRTLEEMDKHNIVKSFICDSFEDVCTWMDYAPERFIPGVVISGNPPQPSVEEIREEFKAGHITCLGEIATQYDGLAPNDPLLEPYWALAEELDAPMLIHTQAGGAMYSAFRVRHGYPLLLEDVLVKHPKLRLWVENAGYPFLDEIIALMSMYPNVYADLSTMTWIYQRKGFHDYLKRLIEAGFPELRGGKNAIVWGDPIAKRLMFGSDQMCWPETISMAVEAIESADFLSDTQKRDIYYNNAVRFLRL